MPSESQRKFLQRVLPLGPPEKLTPRWLYYSGEMLGAERTDGLSLNTPIGPEIDFINEISERLEVGPTVALDFGGGLGASMHAVAANFPDEIRSGVLRLIVTNKESLRPQVIVEEADRRLDLFGSVKGWEDWVSETSNKEAELRGCPIGADAYLALQRMKPILADRDAVEFVRQQLQVDAVEYIGGVDAEKLPQRLVHKGIMGVDLVHEKLGGLFHSPNKPKALEAVLNFLCPGGIMITTQHLGHREYSDVNERAGIPSEDPFQWKPFDYKKYEIK